MAWFSRVPPDKDLLEEAAKWIASKGDHKTTLYEMRLNTKIALLARGREIDEIERVLEALFR